MRSITFAAIGFAFTLSAALAQTPPHTGRPTGNRPMQSAAPVLMQGRAATQDVDRAFNGGGVILEGPPGAPAPVPQALLPMQGNDIVVQVPSAGAPPRPGMGSKP